MDTTHHESSPVFVPATRPPITPFYLAATAALLVIGLCLRIYDLGAQELWLDETRSWHMTTVTHWTGPRSMAENNTPPLYYLLLRAWSHIAGDSPEVLRLPSVLFGTLFVGTTIWAGREIFNPRVGLWSGVLAALSPLQIYYSQEARSYILLMLLLMLAYGSLWRALETDRVRFWVAYGISTLLSLHCHYLAFLGLATTVLLVFASTTQSVRRWIRYCSVTAMSALLLAPWLAASFLLTPHDVVTQRYLWMELLWEKIPPSLAVIRSLEVFGLGGHQGSLANKQFTALWISPELEWLGIGILLAIVVVAVLPYADRELSIVPFRRLKVWLIASVFVPLSALWVVSYFIKPIYLLGRYDVVAFPGFVLLMGVGLVKCARLPRLGMILGPAVGAILILMIGFRLAAYYRAGGPSISARETASWIDARVESGDVVVVTRDFNLPVRYYLTQSDNECDGGYCRKRSSGKQFAYRGYPPDIETDPLGVHGRRGRFSRREVQGNLHKFLDQLGERARTLWIVAHYAPKVAGRTFSLRPIEYQLVAEIHRSGFNSTLVNRNPLILKFGRNAKGPPAQ